MSEHAGSTSVPGLVAKPIIDIILAVANSGDESTCAPVLEAAGYQLRIREPEWEEHRVLKESKPDVNLHVFTIGSSEITRMLMLRDWLRAHSADRELYAATKRELAARTWKYVQQAGPARASTEPSTRPCRQAHGAPLRGGSAAPAGSGPVRDGARAAQPGRARHALRPLDDPGDVLAPPATLFVYVP